MLTKEQAQAIEGQHDRPEDVAKAVEKQVGRRASAADLRRAASKLSTEELRFAVMERADKLAQITKDRGFADPTRLSGGTEELSEEDFNALVGSSTEAAMSEFGNVPDLGKGAIHIDTVRLAVTSTGGYTQATPVPESSGPRYSLAGLYRKALEKSGEDGDLRPRRVQMITPPNKLTPETVGELAGQNAKLAQYVAMPKRSKAIKLADQGTLRSWQVQKAEQAITAYAEEHGLIPVFCDPEQRIKGTMFYQCPVLLLDEAEVSRFTENVGEVHYGSGFVSGVGTRPNGDPDYREYGYVALEPHEVAPLSELLGHGTFEEGAIGDGRSPLLLPEWPEDDHDALEFQFRAITGYDRSEKTGRPSLSKGMCRPYHPSALRQALAYFQHEISAEDKERYQRAADLIQTVVNQGEPLMVLVRGDQMKIGAETTPTYGRAIVAATYLRGHHDTEVVEREVYDEDDPECGSVRNVRVPKPQYEISMNSQITQLLSPEGIELAEEHLQTEAEILEGKTHTIRGVAEIASDKTKRRVEQMEQLHADDSAYDAAREGSADDQFTDAVLFGGVRMKGTDWLKALQGKRGTLQMLPSTRSRFDKVVNAYIRRYLYRGMGGYGFGFHHATVENSTGLLWNMYGNYEGIPSKETYLKQSRDGCAAIKTPLADRSAIAMPRKVTGLMNADDDGDITISLAAHMQIPGFDETVIVVLSWRYPCVDVPILWVLPKEMPCPFLGRTEEERERFERIIRIFGPEIQPTALGPGGEQVENPGVYDDGITRASATNAYRLMGKGAKGGDKEKRNGELTQESAMKLIRAKRELNTTGTLTRDLERIGDTLRELKRRGQDARGKGFSVMGDRCDEAFQTVLRRGAACAKSIEANLTAFKYKQKADVSPPEMAVELLEWHDEKEVRQDLFPLDYHNVIDTVVAATEGHRRTTWSTPDWETSFEKWQGPTGSSDHAAMLRRLVQNEVKDIVASVEAIETDREPFLAAIRRRMKRWKKQMKAELPEDEWRPRMQEVAQEAKYVERLCQFYRAFWRELLGNKLKRMQEKAEDKEAAARKAEKISSRAGRHIHLVMQSAGQSISAEGLAYGVYKDWDYTSRDRDGTVRQNSLAAGMALITGRNGDVFYRSTTADHTPLQGKDSKHVVVWRSGAALPISAYGESREVTDIGVDNDRQVIALVLAETETEEAEGITVNFGDDAQVPESFPEEITVHLARTSDQQGVLYWRYK